MSGTGTEQQVRNEKFDYSPYQVISRQGPAQNNEPSGEPVSLVGKLHPKDMGKNAQRQKVPDDLKQKKNIVETKQKKKQNLINPKKKKKIKLLLNQTVNNIEIDGTIIYKPKTKENRLIYEQILQRVHKIVGDVSHNDLISFTDEILATLKMDDLQDKVKKTYVENMIGGSVEQEIFDLFLNLAKQITDYHAETDINQQDRQEEQQEIVALDDDDEDQESEDENMGLVQGQFQKKILKYYLRSEDDEDEDNDDDFQKVNQDMEEEQNQAIRATGGIEIEDEDQYEKYFVDVIDIDAFWLQSKLNKYLNDPSEAKKLEVEVLKILNQETNTDQIQNQLVTLLTVQNFELVQILTKNRHKIYYCTYLNQAQSNQEKQLIKNKMQKSAEGQEVLDLVENIGIRKEKTQQQLQQKNTMQKMKNEVRKVKQDQIDVEDDQILGLKNITDEEFNRIGKKILDLDKLVFNQGGHFMSNEKCKLPADSFRVNKKGYDEIYIPAISQKPQQISLIQIENMPKWSQSAFKGVKELNLIQTKVFETAFNSSENMLICAPTGAGKTNIALLAMLQVIGNYIKSDGSVDLNKFKIVYIAPMKALVSELVGNFKNRLEKLNITVRELTGDMQLSKQQIEETQLIIATPEKWDIITRKSGEKTFTELVKLLIIDEIHLLHDGRGPVLEALVARTIRNIEQTQEMVRIVGLSATLPNYSDVASFIRVKANKGLFFFDSSFRPVPLEQQYIGITEKKAVRKNMLMNEILYEKIMERAGKFQMIIFVHSRRDTVKTAKAIKEMAFAKDELQKILPDESDSKKILEGVLEKEKIYSTDLKELLLCGFAIHHAGLARMDRDLVEHLFGDKHIQVLISTSTLAWGVNLPAHTVIIKGTQIYSPEMGKWTELSPQDILQMMGRAGRPRFDTKGEGVIITSQQELKFYLSLLNQQLPIESQFVSQIADQLNAEVVLGTVCNVKDGVNWLGYTYLYIRMMRNPSVYSISEEEMSSDPLLIKRRADLIHTAATILDKNNLIKYDKKSGIFTVTSLGKIASHYYIKYPSIQIYNDNLKSNMSMIELFRVFALSSEFQFIPIREEEKSEIVKLIETVPVPIKGSPDDPTTKINILLQAYIGKLPLEGYALNSDMVYITQSAGRIMRAIFEICLKRGWAQVAEIALNICKMIDKRMWGCQTLLRQFKGIPEEILRRIERKEQFTFDHFYNMSAQQIGELVKLPKIGKVLHKLIHQFPKLELQPYLQPITRSCLKIDLTIKTDFQWEEKIHGKSEPFWILVTDCNGEDILYSEYINIKSKYFDVKDYVFQFTVPLYENLHPLYYIKVISDRWLQSDAVLPISFKNLMLPERFLAPTELFDYSLLPLSSLNWKEGEKMFKDLGIKQFNQIQTQVFQSFYQLDENIFLGAATGSGKSICILLAMLKVFKNYPTQKIVYVSPQDSLCQIFFKQCKESFEPFKKSVALLTGQTNTDNQILEKYDVIISNPENFDILSRRWKAKKAFQNIKLFVVDEIHLLNENNAVLEVITSRMRFASSQLDNKIQIVACGTSLADYREIASWIGSSQKSTYNFHPNVRPFPLDIHINSFDQNQKKGRIHQMQKQMYNAFKQYFNDENQGIVFVSDRKQARITALDLMTLASSDNTPTRFLKITPEKMKVVIQSINDTYLQHVLSVGIGFLYEGMDEKERQLVEDLYHGGAIQVLISTYKLSWDLTIHAYLVIILDNQRYDGQEKRYIDYTIPDMLQMMGRAQNKLQQGVSAKCFVMCHAPKKDYYKKFLFEPYPVESSLNQHLTDHICSEIVAKTITSNRDCVDWITWTFLYWRLIQNPNFYNLQEITKTAINEYISEAIETAVKELEEMKCIAIEGDEELIPLNLGIISSYYYILTSTIEIFSENIKEDSKMKQLIEILSNSTEFDNIQIRQGEEQILKQLAEHIDYKIDSPDFTQPTTKTNILLQCHFSRIDLSSDFVFDQKIILENTIRLLHAMIDVINSNSWLQTAIKAMQLCQMVVQAQWANQSPLLQLPHFDTQLIASLKKLKVEDIADFLNMEDDDRNKILSHLSKSEIEEIALASNKYPSISLQYDIQEPDEIYENETVQINVLLQREGDEYYDYVSSPFYPKQKEEQWWIIIGDKKQNKLLTIKRNNFKQKAKIELKFEAPKGVGENNLSIYLICDSYIGCDQVENFSIKIKPAKEQESEGDSQVEEEQ